MPSHFLFIFWVLTFFCDIPDYSLHRTITQTPAPNAVRIVNTADEILWISSISSCSHPSRKKQKKKNTCQTSKRRLSFDTIWLLLNSWTETFLLYVYNLGLPVLHLGFHFVISVLGLSPSRIVLPNCELTSLCISINKVCKVFLCALLCTFRSESSYSIGPFAWFLITCLFSQLTCP